MQVNIYLPDDLATRVRAAEGLNVSRVCQAALEQELEMVQAKEAARTDLEAAAVRLRKSHGNWDKEVRSLGYELGSDWAKTWAEWAELDWLDAPAESWGVPEHVLEQRHASIREYLSTLEDVPAFEDNGEDPFFVAFLDGARETFREIRRLM